MVWNTGSGGERTLDGDEKDLFRDGMVCLLDTIEAARDEDGDDYWLETGIAAFDCLVFKEQITTLYFVARGLMDPTFPPPELSASLESCVAAVFLEICDQIQCEIEFATLQKKEQSPQNGHDSVDQRSEYVVWRQKVLAAASERGLEDLPDVVSENLKEWDFQVQLLEEQILHDRDFQMINHWADIPKDTPAAGMIFVGVHPDYFSAKVPRYEGSEFRRIYRSLQNFVRHEEL